MTRINDTGQVGEARQQEEERRNERRDRDKEKRRAGQDEFARLVSSKQEKTAKATRDQQVQQGKHAGQQAAAHSRLLARQGIQSNTFQQQLQKQGEHSLVDKQLHTESRGQETNESKRAGEQRGSEAIKERIGKQSDKLAAISRDEHDSSKQDSSKQDSKGGGKEFGQQSNMPGQAQGGGQAQAAATATVHSAQGNATTGLPPEVLQQLVERVLVGVNQEGLDEFHIDFKENILAGSSLRITAKDGKINASFYTHDAHVRRLLKASEGELARAFGRKGLTLERLEVEGR